MSSNLLATIIPWVRAFWPAPLAVDRVQGLRMAAGALIGIALTTSLCHRLGAQPPLTWIIAPMGASAVLVFCLPASPLAQPWPVVGGNVVSALVGIACAQWISVPDVAAGVAVALAIGVMLLLRCLHPPGGATALLMVLSGVHDPVVALLPVGLNALLLTLAGLAYNNALRHSYPHRAPPVAAARVTEEDLDAVLGRYNELLDIGRDDLRALIDRTQRLAQQRRLADTRCGDVMTRDIDTVEYGTTLHEAWALMRRKHLKTLPVLDRGRHVVGIVTLSDFLNAAGVDAPATLELRLRALMRPSPATHSSKPEVVGQIMTRKVRVTREHRSLSDLVLLFDSAGHRHIPVVGDTGKLLGMVTQSDVMAALKVGTSLDLAVAPAAV